MQFASLRHLVIGHAIVGLILLAPTVASADGLTRDQARAATQEVIRLVESHYVVKDKRAAIVAALKSAQDAGSYDVTSPLEFGEKMTADLKKASGDGHLYISFKPDQFADLSRPRPAARGPSQDVSALERETARRHNHGFDEQKVLAGNVRYVRISGFMWDEKNTPAVIDAAARFLSEGDAIVIDLRGNGGGHASAVQRLISYFFASGTRELMTFQDGLSGETSINRALAKLPSPRLNTKPLYVLIDGGAGSAAEEFAYHVQQFKLGTLIGQTTAGAANNNQLFPVAPYFVASVSVGRPIHPVSRSNWEQAGVAPDVTTPSAEALDQAHMLALKQLIARATLGQRPAYEWEVAGLEARLTPIRLSENALDAYAGVYGERKIWREGPSLKFQRANRPVTELVPMGQDLFGFANLPPVRLMFRRKDGRVIGFDQVTREGVVASIDRTG
jgi:Peptidase family S41/N-terminal domain of Peptidase_S41 in eukaryotic IRBP